MKILLISLACALAAASPVVMTALYFFWIGKGESDVNGEKERDSKQID
jgi:hypothetical protein